MTMFAATTLVVALLGTLLVAPRMARLRHLRPDPQDLDGPATAVVVAARDEAERVEEALRSLLERSGPRTRLVVVDDRSTDDAEANAESVASLAARLDRAGVELDWIAPAHSGPIQGAATLFALQ